MRFKDIQGGEWGMLVIVCNLVFKERLEIKKIFIFLVNMVGNRIYVKKQNWGNIR